MLCTAKNAPKGNRTVDSMRRQDEIDPSLLNAMESVLAGDFYRRKADRRLSGIDITEFLVSFAIHTRYSTEIRGTIASVLTFVAGTPLFLDNL